MTNTALASVISLGERRAQVQAQQEQMLISRLRAKQAELVEVYKRKNHVQEISDKLIDEIKREFSADEWRAYGHRLDEVWNAARHSDDEMSYTAAVLYEAIKTLEGRR